MKSTYLLLLGFALCSLFTAVNPVLAQSTAFTYNGRLNDNGAPANGNFDLRFTIYDSDVGVNIVAGPLPVIPVDVVNGLFTLRLDFGAGVFTGPARWLNIEVRPTGGGNFTPLTPRQEVTSSPYAIRAQTAGTAGTAADVNVGTVVKSLNGLRDDLTLAAGANLTITPNGNTLTLAAAGAGGSGIWSVNGNNAYYTAGNVGIGTSTPAHRLSLAGGPAWTANGWLGSVDLPNGSALAWAANTAGQRFGMGHANTGFYLFRTLSNPGTTGSPALYDFTVNDAGNVGIGTTTPSGKLEIVAQDALTITGYQPFMTFRDSNAGNARGRIQSVSGDMNLFTESYMSGANTFAFLKLANNGNVGLGSATPVGKLEVVAQDALRLIGYQPFLTILDSSAGYARSRIQGDGGSVNLFTESYMSGANPFSYLTLNNSGNVGIGSATPVAKLEVVAQDALRLIGYQPFLTILDSSAGYARSRIQGAGGEMLLVPESYLNGSDGNAYVKLFNSGNLSVKSLTIRGGADLAEPFELSATDIAKSSVVIIDDEQPGKLKLSSQAYDTRVAGIVSGANGVNPGISLHQDGVLESGQNVALSGRVYVQADATFGAIKPGDMLTTSGTPGHAMKVTDHAKAQGAILGKAMSPLKQGKGMVLVLVTLQ